MYFINLTASDDANQLVQGHAFGHFKGAGFKLGAEFECLNPLNEGLSVRDEAFFNQQLRYGIARRTTFDLYCKLFAARLRLGGAAVIRITA